MAKKKRAAKTAQTAPSDTTVAAAEATNAERRSQLPDGKRPHDTFTWGDAIALGLVDPVSDTGNEPAIDA